MSMINEHAQASERLIKKKEFLAIARVVGQHHHKKDEGFYHIAVDSLQVSSNMVDILHLADVEQALANHQSYKKRFTSTKVIAILIDHVNEGRIRKEIAYLWIKDEREKINHKKEPSKLNSQQKINFQKIDDFILGFESDKHKNDLENWIVKHEKIQLKRVA